MAGRQIDGDTIDVPNPVKPPAGLVGRQLQLDSMDFLDIVMELRKRHGIEVPEADYLQLASLDSSAEYLTPKFNALAAKG